MIVEIAILSVLDVVPHFEPKVTLDKRSGEFGWHNECDDEGGCSIKPLHSRPIWVLRPGH